MAETSVFSVSSCSISYSQIRHRSRLTPNGSAFGWTINFGVLRNPRFAVGGGDRREFQALRRRLRWPTPQWSTVAGQKEIAALQMCQSAAMVQIQTECVEPIGATLRMLRGESWPVSLISPHTMRREQTA